MAAAIARAPTSHNCGACGARLFSARLRDTGLLIHVERDAPSGDLIIVPELPGITAALPHVARITGRRTAFREHWCAAYVTRGPQRKRRP